ncbi:MAG TPA: Gfo/Idh/MocA family oxidoreductase [Terriglobia bacterium]|nr:Gfo/Idh/MocA family oxidoreductase [Terriglobia bacterium]
MGQKRITRRSFMGKAAGVTGGMMAARSIMLEATPIGLPARPPAPSDTIRFGIIGVGMRGGGLLPTAIKLPGVECVAACELYTSRQELAKQIVGKPIQITERYQDLLDRKDIDCILAPVPDHWHERIVLDCCKAGKDVYVEKPMTHEVQQGFPIIDAAKKYNRIVQVGSQEPSSMLYTKARELMQQGVIGDVCLVESSMGRNSPCGAWRYAIPPNLSPQTVNWTTWLGSAPKRPFSKERFTRWRCWEDYGEGISGDLFIHSLTGIHCAMDVKAPPKRAATMGGLFRWHDGRDFPDVMTTVYDYANFRAMLRVTLNTSESEVYRFMGTHGILEMGGIENPRGFTIMPQDGKNHNPCAPAWPSEMEAAYSKKWHAEHDTPPGEAKAIESVSYYAPPDYDSTREHLWNFFQSVRTRRPSIEGPEFGNNAAIACHMANYAYFNNAIAVWDHEARKLTSA